jgi:hypothetical protein
MSRELDHGPNPVSDYDFRTSIPSAKFLSDSRRRYPFMLANAGMTKEANPNRLPYGPPVWWLYRDFLAISIS